eukprot:4540856-Ditylum_brightwellii.AAC.1
MTLKGIVPPLLYMLIHLDLGFLKMNKSEKGRLVLTKKFLLIMIPAMVWLLLHRKLLLEKITMKGKEIHLDSLLIIIQAAA